MFESILTNTEGLNYAEAAICCIASLVLGLAIALVYTVKSTYTKGLIMTIAMLPLIVQVIIMMVNGNLGVGVAVMGAFSLVRFRSAPGGAKEICAVFMAMAIGLATGMGYITFAAAVTVILCVALLAFNLSGFGTNSKHAQHTLRITVPEQLNSDDAFKEIFEKYLFSCVLEKVKTSSMGSLFEFTYTVRLKNVNNQKEMIDAIRERNGNLPISCTRIESEGNEIL